MLEGIVIRVVPARGFGFVRQDGATSDLFFHEDAVLGDEIPEAGDRVSFEVAVGGTRPRAINVLRLVEGRSR